MNRRRGSRPPVDHGLLFEEVRAALAAGAAPGAALVAGVSRDPHPGEGLFELARAVRLGQPIAESATAFTTTMEDGAVDLLVRALGVAEQAGAGGLLAVEQALEAAADEAETGRRLRAKTAQARGTALILSILPVTAWLLFMALDPAMLAFYGTIAGAISGVVALCLALTGRWWASRIIARSGRAAWWADPLAARSPPPDVRRALFLAVPAFAILGIGLGVVPGAAAAAVVAAVGARPARPAEPIADLAQGGAAETVELVAVALASGLGPMAALGVVARLAPPAARGPLEQGARRLAAGEPADVALADGGLAMLGAALAAAERWGAPAEPALRRLAAELRARRRSASEEAAERAQLALVFPTTLLTLPAFTVGVVPPMLWTAFSGVGG